MRNKEKKMHFVNHVCFNPKHYTEESLEAKYRKEMEQYENFPYFDEPPKRTECPKLNGVKYSELTIDDMVKDLKNEYQGLYDVISEELRIYEVRGRLVGNHVGNIFSKLTETQKSLFRIHSLTSCEDEVITAFYNRLTFDRGLNPISFPSVIDVLGELDYDIDIEKNIARKYHLVYEYHFFLSFEYASYLFKTKNVPFYDYHGNYKNGYANADNFNYCNVKPEDEIRIFKRHEQKAMDCYLEFQDNLPTDHGYG